MSKIKPHPFAQLLGLQPARLPNTENHTVVAGGRKLAKGANVRKIAEELVGSDDPDEARLLAERLRVAKDKARMAGRYQTERRKPDDMGKRKSWNETHAEERRAYMREYRRKNRERLRQLQTAWARRKYHENPEHFAAVQRAYYASHRDEVLARAKAKYDAKKAAKAAPPNPNQGENRDEQS